MQRSSLSLSFSLSFSFSFSHTLSLPLYCPVSFGHEEIFVLSRFSFVLFAETFFRSCFDFGSRNNWKGPKFEGKPKPESKVRLFRLPVIRQPSWTGCFVRRIPVQLRLIRRLGSSGSGSEEPRPTRIHRSSRIWWRQRHLGENGEIILKCCGDIRDRPDRKVAGLNLPTTRWFFSVKFLLNMSTFSIFAVYETIVWDVKLNCTQFLHERDAICAQ